MPFKVPWIFSTLKYILKPSATSMKSKGYKWQPCQIPLLAWKKGNATPLIRTESDTIVIKLMIHMIKAIPKQR